MHEMIQNSTPLAWAVLIVAFVVLAKCADIFVDSSISIAKRFQIPRLVIGIVLVSLATTAPELSVSMVSAIHGKPDIALGNAIGSVICNNGLALALGGMVSVAAIPVIPRVLRISGAFLGLVSVLSFAFVAFDATLSRGEGMVLVLLFAGYIALLYSQHKKGSYREDIDVLEDTGALRISLPRLTLLFLVGIGGIIIASEFIVTSATGIALSLGVPRGVIALTLVALGTSIPEVATCITAARKKEGALAVGNILGADIMNLCWVAGASAIANDLVLSRKEIFFMFPSMFVIVGAMLGLLWYGHSLTRRKSLIIMALYVAYLGSFFLFFPIGR